VSFALVVSRHALRASLAALALLGLVIALPSPVLAEEPVGGLAFTRAGHLPVPAAETFQPWRRSTPATKSDPGLDADGVKMQPRPDGKWYDHPVGQASYGLRSLNTWRQTGDAFFLQRALANADRLLDRRLEARGAWWYPYGFDFQLRDSDVVMTAPWYSGMAQGEALSLFSQLASALPPESSSAAEAYRTAAELTFRSLTLGPEAQPWVSMVDGEGYLWVQEYPQEPSTESDFTYNGYGFVALGLWDYWRLTGSAEASAYLDGAVTTLARYQPVVRNPGWASGYSLRNPWPHVNYHVIHTDQLLQLSWLTGQRALAGLSDELFLDYPARSQRGTVIFAPGTHELYRFGADGAITGRRSLVTTRTTSAPTMARVRIHHRGIHYRITGGPFLDWYAVEVPRRSWLRGIRLERQYAPSRPAVLAAGRAVSFVAFDSSGRESGRRTWTPTQPTTVAVNRMAVINGMLCLRVSAGTFAGRWFVHSAAHLD